MSRNEQPPTMDYFERDRPESGPATLAIRLGPLEVELRGLDVELAAVLRERYSPYSSAGSAGAEALRLRLVTDDGEHYVPPGPPMSLVQVRIACDGERVRYMSHRIAGWFDTVGGSGLAVMRRGEYQTKPRAIENFLRAAVAWQAVCRGGALVHAAGAVRNDRAYLFYGESGAGKSTLSACNRRGRIVSDDLSLLLPGENGHLDLVGSPFRGTYEEGDPVVGRFPIAAGFRLIQAEVAAVHAVPRVRAMAELVGNLPFVAEAFSDRPDLFEQIRNNFASVPLGHLHFRKDDSYWDAIENAGY